VTQRQVPAETARRELLIEMERRRALGRIYKERRDLDIRVQKPEDGTPPAPPATPPPAPKESSQ
jgi:hypothetical protein